MEVQQVTITNTLLAYAKLVNVCRTKNNRKFPVSSGVEYISPSQLGRDALACLTISPPNQPKLQICSSLV
uniref:Vacuolar protein sorting-associated protein 45-like protein n=1 Tax=Rhizophora mucronata TaxID=61149 RepID=A0A2P2KQX6_RHIMU